MMIWIYVHYLAGFLPKMVMKQVLPQREARVLHFFQKEYLTW